MNWRPTQERKLKSRSEEMEALRARAEQPAAAAELEKLRKSAFEQKLTHRRGLERAEARAEEAEARVAEARVAQEQRVSEGPLDSKILYGKPERQLNRLLWPRVSADKLASN